ncbi:hypothetical protein [Desulfovibrio desulfuricans]|uniref:hypothetical protein n=1 Tax=Desulfovibrio desulfuricans TaxID=876 RepID=UPI00398431FD
MNKTWVVIGGILAGIAGVFTAAFVAEALEAKGNTTLEGNGKLALPEGDGR